MSLVVEGKYRLINKLGEGSFGKIYAASNKNTGEEVAVKIEKSSGKILLKNEARMYALLSDTRGIPAMRSYGVEGEYHYLVMDMMGYSLEEIKNICGGSLSLKTVLSVGLQMLRRIESIHEKGIVHRDIKPDNFILGRNESSHQVFLIDFGLARAYRLDKGTHVEVETGRRLTGTARYASRNVQRGVLPSRRDDLISMGYILLYLHHGSLPWQHPRGEKREDRHNAILKCKEDTELWRAFPNVPGEFVVLLRYCESMAFDEDPDYSYIKSLFLNLYRLHKYPVDNVFDWTVLDNSNSGSK